MMASENGHKDAVELLLDNGANPNMQNYVRAEINIILSHYHCYHLNTTISVMRMKISLEPQRLCLPVSGVTKAL